MMSIYFPPDLAVVPGLIILTIVIFEIRRNSKTNHPESDDKGIMVMPIIFTFVLAGTAYLYFFVPSTETQESVYAGVKWFSLICSLIYLILYTRKRLIQARQAKSP